MRCSFAVVAVVLVLGAAGRAAASPCKKRGVAVYREVREPLVPATDAEPASVPTVTIEVRSSGTWTRVESGEAGSGEAIGRSGCLTRAQLAEVTRAIRRARFEAAAPSGCDAVTTTRVVMTAPRRHRRVERQVPCGPDADPATRQLATCVAVATDTADRSSDLRAVCRGR